MSQEGSFTTNRELLVVIPHHHRQDLLRKTLLSLKGWPVLVVDDGPGLAEGSLDPGVMLRRGARCGFAAAANVGLMAAQEAGFRRVLLLNDDAVPLDDCVSRLLHAMIADPSVGAVGPLLVDPEGQVESAGMKVRLSGARVYHLRDRPPQPREVDALSGACLLLGAEHRLDEAFEFYFEDVELCRRLRAQGLRILLDPGARCLHVGGATLSRASPEASARAVAGHLRLVGGSGSRRLLVLGFALAQVLREGGPVERISGIYRGWKGEIKDPRSRRPSALSRQEAERGLAGWPSSDRACGP